MTFYDFTSLTEGDITITNRLGKLDTWIGSGMLRPVYFLEDNKVVVFHFKYPAACEDLKQVVLIIGKWRHYKDKNKETFCIIYDFHFRKNATTEMLINILSLLVGRYLGNNRWWLEETFYEIISK